ncbi:type VI secretion protein [Methylosinus sp. R-45379]|uniref:type VI secretion system baseplate subunit TssK n=1 Tax=unclassified Methylosinus TaxID=2624500 RepID=UPI0004650A7D|nr:MULTISPECIES: type VI secretion system baseplate subunit TssK [unclassified Methylosinus]OAI25842.1 type VI secretion protein [Methylosinus sp. R-45379]
MSWRSKVVWREGLFLRPHHLQQNDRYLERIIESRTRHASPYPWGFAQLEIDSDLAQQSKIALRKAAGVMPDGTPFDIPGEGPAPASIEAPAKAAGLTVWLTLPNASPNSREVDYRAKDVASRFTEGVETIIDSVAEMRDEEEIDVAHLRLELEIGRRPKPGYDCLAIARILEIRDKVIIFDPNFAPPLLVCAAHSVVTGWIDRVIGWVDNKLEELARYAADPSSGGGMQSADYLLLQTLNRAAPLLRHLRQSGYTHPERLYTSLASLAGELATFGSQQRRSRIYPAYDHDDLENVFEPILRDLQEFLSARTSRRARRMELVQRAPNVYISPIRDRALLGNATLVLEVASDRPPSEIQQLLPQLLKVGPNNRMNDIVYANLPGIPLVHMPTPPGQIRTISHHVYFYLDRHSPLWREFSVAASIGLHFSGDWPELELELWAIAEEAL